MPIGSMSTRITLLAFASKSGLGRILPDLQNDGRIDVEGESHVERILARCLKDPPDVLLADLQGFPIERMVRALGEVAMGRPLIVICSPESEWPNDIAAANIHIVRAGPPPWPLLAELVVTIVRQHDVSRDASELVLDLKHHRSALNMLIHSMEHPAALVNRTGRIMAANAAFHDLSGLDTGAGLDRGFWHRDDRTSWQAMLDGRAERGELRCARASDLTVGIRMIGPLGGDSVFLLQGGSGMPSGSARAPCRVGLDNLEAGVSGSSAIVQIIGLEDVRERLGNRWEAMRERIRAICVHVIEPALSSRDAYEFTEGDDLLICFVGESEETAELRARHITRKIKQRLIGNEGFADEPISRELGNCHFDVVTVSFDAETMASGETLRSWLREAVEQKRRTFVPIADDRREHFLAGLRPAYRQVEHADLYPSSLVRVSLDATGEEMLDELMQAPIERTELRAELDLRMLELQCQRLIAGDHNARNLYVVDVALETLERPRQRQVYHDLMKADGPVIQKHVVLNIVCRERTAYPPRIAKTIHWLRTLTSHLALQAPAEVLAHYEDSGHAIEYLVFDCHEWQNLAARRDAQRNIAALAQRTGAAILIDNVPFEGIHRKIGPLTCDYVVDAF
ncbi:MAG: hypothetical protein R3C97_00505 [Geminicoccaceae bacterium]